MARSRRDGALWARLARRVGTTPGVDDVDAEYLPLDPVTGALLVTGAGAAPSTATALYLADGDAAAGQARVISGRLQVDPGSLTTTPDSRDLATNSVLAPLLTAIRDRLLSVLTVDTGLAQPLTNTQLRAAAVPVTNGQAQPLTDTQLRAAPVAVTNGQAQPLTDAQLRASAVTTTDSYLSSEYLADQTGTGAVLTFTFASPVDLLILHAEGGVCRYAAGAGNTPAANAGGYLAAGETVYYPRRTTVASVYAPAGAVVSAWGTRY